MVFNVRCFKCGEPEVRLVLGGRAIIHARCHGCDSNLLAEIMEFEQEIYAEGEETVVEDVSGPSTQALAAIPSNRTDEEAVPPSS